MWTRISRQISLKRAKRKSIDSDSGEEEVLDKTTNTTKKPRLAAQYILWKYTPIIAPKTI
jgi:hypothetical protein